MASPAAAAGPAGVAARRISPSLPPQLPPSDLTGQLHITTDADGVWRFRTDIANPQAGPWDAPALPLQQLQAQAQFDGQVWTLDQLQLQLPHGPKVPKAQADKKGPRHSASRIPGTPGGQLQAQGQWTVATQALNAQVQLQGINPAHVLTSLPSQRISGSASAETLPPLTLPRSTDTTDPTDTAAAQSSHRLSRGHRRPASPPHQPGPCPRPRPLGRWRAEPCQEVAIRAWGAESVQPQPKLGQPAAPSQQPQTTRLQVPGLAPNSPAP